LFLDLQSLFASSLRLNKRLFSFLHSKDYIPHVPEVIKAISDIEKDVLSTKVNKKSKFVVTKNEVAAEEKRKEDLGKEELTSVTKQKIISEVSKYEISGKVIYQYFFCK
jgi:hypothetical protein